MPKRTDIHKILIIGSGPIVIGQAAEFDYSGTQACLALREQGYFVILVNSNPATIMTDVHMADKVYMEPLTLEYVARIIRKERPDALLPTLGGQTGLNIAVQLAKKGILSECRCELLGTSVESIEQAEDREKFKALCQRINEPCIESGAVNDVQSALEIAEKIGFPVILRPAFTLGGSGGGFAHTPDELKKLAELALRISPVSQVLVERSIKGYKEIEYEVMHDKNGTAITVCNMENLDPVGIHTGDSIVVCPSQTLTNKEYHMLRDSALHIVRELGIEGGCNVQFALDPFSSEYFIIEVNPRVSRSSALASKASGYPIARVSALISVGMCLDEIRIANTPASFEPTLDYVVTKIPRFPFDKFDQVPRELTTQMKSTGEVMAIGRNMEESLLKAIRSLELGISHLWLRKFDTYETNELLSILRAPTDECIYAIAELLRRDVDPILICNLTKIDLFFVAKMENIVRLERELKEQPGNIDCLRKVKTFGFSDDYIAYLWGKTPEEMFRLRQENGIVPVYKMIDTCASEFDSYVAYFYSTYESENESKVTANKRKIIVLGSGPVRVGQGIEFDYSTVHAIWAIQEAGFEAIIINNNPGTVSTDYSISDKLYFEPLCVEDIMNIISLEKPDGVIVSLGGQTAINLAEKIEKMGASIIGTSIDAIKNAENRGSFEKCLKKLGIPHPEGKLVTTLQDGKRAAGELGYPVLVRPSFVLGGRAMRIIHSDSELCQYFNDAVLANEGCPVWVDRYISGKELDVDAVCDGKDVFIPGIMEHVERTGVHSGDSISIYPTFSIKPKVKEAVIDYTIRLGVGIGIVGPFNVQFIVDGNDQVFVIEVNPRSSRTIPFISKSTGINLANVATKVQMGQSLKDQGLGTYMAAEKKRWYVKTPVFSFAKILGADACLSPEMKSTGEAIGYDDTLNKALYKALKASGLRVKNYGTVFVTVADSDKSRALPLVRKFYDLGFNIEATKGTSDFLKKNGIKTRAKKKISEGNSEILDSLRQGYIAYVVNTLSLDEMGRRDGFMIRRQAVESNVNIFTSLDTVAVLLDVLSDITLGVSTVNSEVLHEKASILRDQEEPTPS
ncbi:MAG: carbamoyl-phosphate synthase large subunit [Oscillospiraceae bacterium]|jgi:carbamoyl-phosphate synthase large subunit|nr:carbamoyl-phosphate synthase large subunit [Oscillospiraceae bacterium]